GLGVIDRLERVRGVLAGTRLPSGVDRGIRGVDRVLRRLGAACDEEQDEHERQHGHHLAHSFWDLLFSSAPASFGRYDNVSMPGAASVSRAQARPHYYVRGKN